MKRIKRLAKEQGVEVEETQGKGSHRKYRVGDCTTTVPFHAG